MSVRKFNMQDLQALLSIPAAHNQASFTCPFHSHLSGSVSQGVWTLCQAIQGTRKDTRLWQGGGDPCDTRGRYQRNIGKTQILSPRCVTQQHHTPSRSAILEPSFSDYKIKVYSVRFILYIYFSNIHCSKILEFKRLWPWINHMILCQNTLPFLTLLYIFSFCLISFELS